MSCSILCKKTEISVVKDHAYQRHPGIEDLNFSSTKRNLLDVQQLEFVKATSKNLSVTIYYPRAEDP